MRRLLAVAELRLREASAARLVALVPLAFLGGIAIARWAPGTDPADRAAAADRVVLACAGGTAILVVLLLAATAFAEDVRRGRALALLATPVSRAEVAVGGIVAHAAFGLLLALALAAAGILGLDAAGLGSRARRAVRPMAPAEVLGRGEDGVAVLSRASPSVVCRFRVPEGREPGEPIRARLAARARVESGFDEAGVLLAAVHREGEAPGNPRRVEYKATVAFETELPAGDLVAGEEALLTLVRESGAWSLRFGERSVEIGGARRLFAAEAALAVAGLLPLLVLSAALGAAASARLGATTAIGVVSFLLLVGSGRDVIDDAARYVVARAEAQAETTGGHDHAGHDHGHDAEVTPLQVALARTALGVLGTVPDLASAWRLDEVAAGRAVRREDLAGGASRAAGPCAVAALAAWLLLRRRELTPG